MPQHLHTLSDDARTRSTGFSVTKKRSFCLDMSPFEHHMLLRWLRRARQAMLQRHDVQMFSEV
jgi:hypothetical protein